LSEQEQLVSIRKSLMIAASNIDKVSKQAKPFRRSKFLNMLYKEVKQLQVEVSVFLGDAEFRLLEGNPELTMTCSYRILEAMRDDHELPRQDIGLASNLTQKSRSNENE
jgi:hypothetical protein